MTQSLQAKPIITEERVYYSFKANNRDQIWQQIERNSPKGRVESAGEHLINVALTQLNLTGQYQYQASLTKCKLTTIQPQLHITIHMPHWENSWQADALLVENWNRYVRMVSDHEDIHKQYAIKMVEELEQALLKIGTFKRCNQLKEELEKVRSATLGKYRAQNAWFDAKERVYQKDMNWF